MTKILVVEDEQIIALGLQQELESQGYDVVGTADCAKDALIIAHDNHPDLVLMDVQIRGPMDGIEAGKHIQQMHIPVIYVTAYSDSRTVSRAAESMPYGFITKPYRNAELFASIKIALYKSKLERELRGRQEQLAANQEQFLALIAHEIRNPISTINAAAESLQILDDAITSPERSRRYERIASAVQTVDQVLKLSLDLDKLTATPGHEQPTTELLALTRGVVSQFARDQQARIVVRCWLDEVTVSAPSELLQFALRNLLDNALKFSPAGSAVRVEIDKAVNGQSIRCAITDSGPGIAEADQNRVFERYYRGGTAPDTVGLGLGLYIARNLIEKCGGKLEYRALPAGGSCFEIRLPSRSH